MEIKITVNLNNELKQEDKYAIEDVIKDALDSLKELDLKVVSITVNF